MTDPLSHIPAVLAAVAPSVEAAVWTPLLTAAMRGADITTPRRVACFIGQCAEESGGFTRLDENLNYSAKRLTQVWPNRFPTMVEAAPYAQRPEALANRVYSNREGNGPPESGDGWRFRGGGLLQLTFRNGYAAFAKAIGVSIEDAAAYVRMPEGAARSAAWVWSRMGLNPLADAWDLEAMTRKLNGGLTNFAERVRLCGAALHALGIAPEGGSAVSTHELTADELNARVQRGEPIPVPKDEV